MAKSRSESITVVAWLKRQPAGLVQITDRDALAKAKAEAKEHLQTFMRTQSGILQDSEVEYQVLRPGEETDSEYHKSLVINGQVISIDPSQFYILELDSEKVEPHQVDYIREQLAEAGVRAGVIIGSKGGESVQPVELGDGPRAEQRMNARNALAEAHDNLQQAARRLVGAQADICNDLGLTPGKDSAAAFSDLFVAAERAYDTVEEQLNKDLAAEQRAKKGAEE